MTHTILYVEDNRYNARLFWKYLAKLDYVVLIAETAAEGFEALEKHTIDIIFLDINLPTMDGVEMLKILKEDARYKHIPTIALTANAMYGDKERYLEVGFDDYLAKPLTRVELLHRLRTYLSE